MVKKKIAVIIVTMNRTKDLKETIISLVKQEGLNEKFKLIIYIVDNSDEDFHNENLKMLKNLKKRYLLHGFSIKVFRPIKNIGAGPGYYLALKQLEPVDFVLKSDDDIIYSSDYIITLLKTFSEDSKWGALSGLVFYYTHPNKIWYLGGRFIKSLIYTKKISFHKVDYITYEVDDLVSCAMLIKYDALVKSGGFDKDFFVYKDDTSLCFRLGKSGYKLGIVGSTKVFHKVPYPARLSPFSIYYDTLNRFIFSKKFHSFGDKLIFLPYMLLFFPIYKIIKLIKLKGITEGLTLSVPLLNAILKGMVILKKNDSLFKNNDLKFEVIDI